MTFLTASIIIKKCRIGPGGREVFDEELAGHGESELREGQLRLTSSAEKSREADVIPLS